MRMAPQAAPTPATELWTVVRAGPQIDPRRLAAAIAAAVTEDLLDFRSRLLIRDSLNALRRYWGPVQFQHWLATTPQRPALEQILAFDFGEVGFPSLEKRLMEPTDRAAVLNFLRELSLHVRNPTKLYIGGSIALILADQLSRGTEDIDVVDEIPTELRSQHQVLDDLAKRYLLRLTHFQSHYLPDGWQSRVRSLDAFGHLQVFLVDPYDVFLGKLFSSRTKDRDDLRVLLPQLDRTQLTRRLLDSTSSFRSDPRLRAAAEKNWYVLAGEALPTT